MKNVRPSLGNYIKNQQNQIIDEERTEYTEDSQYHRKVVSLDKHERSP